MGLRQLVMIVSVAVGVSKVLGAAAAESTDYRFAAGDVIEITVTPQRDFNRMVTVQPDGKISYPIVGQLQAAGLSVEQLAEKLRVGLDRDLVDPRVTVSLKELSKRAAKRVSLLGAVRNPGVFEIRDDTTIAEVLASGGGPTRTADLNRVTITRADQSVTTVDLAQTDQTGRLVRNVMLQPGDLVVVPEGSAPTVLVLGEVMKPGSYEIPREARLLDALALAGGLTTKGDLGRVSLSRLGAPASRVFDLQPLLAQGDATRPELNVPLQPGDTILVSETDQRVYVVGRVSKPDVYPIKPSARMLDALAMAGGATADGDLSRAVLVRRDAGGQPVSTALDLRKILTHGEMAANDLVRPGDVLYIPDKKARRPLSEVTSLFWPVTSLLNIFRR